VRLPDATKPSDARGGSGVGDGGGVGLFQERSPEITEEGIASEEEAARVDSGEVRGIG
jgi:hypothetical protein